MKMAVFWVVAPCNLVEVYQRFRSLLPPSSRRPDDEGSKDLLNVGKLLPDYTAPQPRGQPSSYSPQIQVRECTHNVTVLARLFCY
jgi:hypothetical protein